MFVFKERQDVQLLGAGAGTLNRGHSTAGLLIKSRDKDANDPVVDKCLALIDHLTLGGVTSTDLCIMSRHLESEELV